MGSKFTTYTERVLKQTPVVLTLKLKPLTLGHTKILKKNNSIFMLYDLETIKKIPFTLLIIETVFAALVCSTTYNEFLNEVETNKFQSECNKYVKLLTKQVKKSSRFNLYDEIKKLADYITDGTQAPYFIPVNKGDKSVGKQTPIEPEQAIVSTLMSNECGWSMDECYNSPLVETLSAYLLYVHEQGGIELKTKEQYELHKETGLTT